VPPNKSKIRECDTQYTHSDAVLRHSLVQRKSIQNELSKISPKAALISEESRNQKRSEKISAKTELTQKVLYRETVT